MLCFVCVCACIGVIRSKLVPGHTHTHIRQHISVQLKEKQWRRKDFHCTDSI